jgi:hypothetical protein
MTAIIHLLTPGTECEEPDCHADAHVHRPPLHHLENDVTWTTADKRVLRIADEMTPRHAWHTIWFLHRHARQREFAYSMQDLMSPFAPQGEMACDMFERELDTRMRYPHLWLDSMPLLRALWDRALDLELPALPDATEPPPGIPDPADRYDWYRAYNSGTLHAAADTRRSRALCSSHVTLDHEHTGFPQPVDRCRYCLQAVQAR